VLEQFLQTGDADADAAASPPPTASHSLPTRATAGNAPVATADPPVKPAATPQPTQPTRVAKKKRMKARARKKLQASTR